MNIDNELKEVLTFTEAAKEYKLKDGSTLRKAVQNGRFFENEIKKVGTTWVVTKAAMDRLYGDKQKLDEEKKPGIAGRIAAAKQKAADQGNITPKKEANKER